MSHGPATESAEPNLVPLLDLVFQLVMFFMMCANFAMEQVSEDIKLPMAQSAKPMDKGEEDPLFLNVNDDGALVVNDGRPPRVSQAEIALFLRQQYKDAEALAKARGDRDGKVKTTIIVRAHRDADFARVFLILRQCKEVGFTKLQLRAIQENVQRG